MLKSAFAAFHHGSQLRKASALRQMFSKSLAQPAAYPQPCEHPFDCPTSAAGSALPIRFLNNNFGGWNGHASIDWPDLGLAAAIDTTPHHNVLMLYAPLDCCRAVLPAMIENRHGVIHNIASKHAFTINEHTFPYPLAKHALLGMTKSLGLEYASKGIRVNALAPGYVATQKVVDYWESFADPEAAKAETLKLHPGGRNATPDGIAMAAVFMLSGECPFMNATSLTVDGGLSVQQHPV